MRDSTFRLASAMTGIDHVLAEGLSLDGRSGGGRLRLAATLQGFPETAHGGGLLAAFHQAAARWMGGAPATDWTVAGQIHKSVPLQTPLPLAIRADGDAVIVTLGEDTRPLARGRVAATTAGPGSGWTGWCRPSDHGLPVPTARGCLACGIENPVGLRVQLRFDDRWVWGECRPPEAYRTPNGRLAPALFTVLLDEMAWWLGALASGEAGVTTDIAIALHRPARASGDALLAVGPRQGVAAVDGKGHFWKTETVVLAADGAPLASGTITFAASRVFSRRLIPQLVKTNPPERLRPIFPAHVP